MSKAAPAENTENNPPKKSKKKLIIILIALFVLCGGGAAAAYFMILAPTEEASQEKVAEAEVVAPEFVTLEPFIVNLSAPDDSRYLQVGITYEVNGPDAVNKIKHFTPVIRSRILMVLSQKNISQLVNIEGKQKLMDELVELARLTIQTDNPEDRTKGIRDVHFSSFVIQ